MPSNTNSRATSLNLPGGPGSKAAQAFIFLNFNIINAVKRALFNQIFKTVPFNVATVKMCLSDTDVFGLMTALPRDPGVIDLNPNI